MSVALDDTDKLKIFHDDAVAFGITFEPPDVNSGGYRFAPVADDTVRYGLGAIKGTGRVRSRRSSPHAKKGWNAPWGRSSLFDFCNRVDRGRINKRVVEALIKAGAFDKLHAERSQMVASIALAFDYADTQAANADQGGLFDFGDSHAASTQEPELIAAAEPWSIKERLGFEKVALGFYLSGHLFDQSGDEVRRIAQRRNRRPGRQPRAAAAGRHRRRSARGQRPARPRRHLQARRPRPRPSGGVQRRAAQRHRELLRTTS